MFRDNDGPKNPFDNLPDEMLDEIFSRARFENFSSISRTCNRFSLFTQPVLKELQLIINHYNKLHYSVSLAHLNNEFDTPGYGMPLFSENHLHLIEAVSDLGLTTLVKKLIAKGHLNLLAFPIYRAIAAGHVDILNVFIKAGINPTCHPNSAYPGPFSKPGISPLSCAIEHNQLACAQVLMAAGASLEDKSYISYQYGFDIYPTYQLINLEKVSEEMLVLLGVTKSELADKQEQYKRDNPPDGLDKDCSIM
jgi:hypothetical protein